MLLHERELQLLLGTEDQKSDQNLIKRDIK